MAKSVLSSDTLPKAGRVNEGINIVFLKGLLSFLIRITHSADMSNGICYFSIVCREWLVHEDGALAYRLQDEESKNFQVFLRYKSILSKL